MADEAITAAVDRLGSCVTAAEVAIDTGVSVDQCEDELRALMVSILIFNTFVHWNVLQVHLLVGCILLQVKCGGDFEMTGESGRAYVCALPVVCPYFNA